jgi:hypothetical protein
MRDEKDKISPKFPTPAMIEYAEYANYRTPQLPP